MKTHTISLILAAICIIGCKSSQPGIINDPRVTGTVLPRYSNTSAGSVYQDMIRGVRRFSSNDHTSRAKLGKYLRDGYISPLQSVNGLKVEELVDDGGYVMAKVTISTDILFKKVKKELTEQGLQQLRTISNHLQANPLTLVTIHCHCEPSTFALRSVLTQERAETVADALAGMGVARERLIEVRGWSDEYPVATNATSEGRAQNRRLEIFICPDSQLFEKILNGEALH